MEANQHKNKRKNSRLILAVFFSVIIIVLLSVYAVLTIPEMFKPSEVTVTGTITASGVTLDSITFTNTGCGTKNEAKISTMDENSGIYTISLLNDYSYNVSIAWGNSGTSLNETEMGEFQVDTFDNTIVKDWSVKP